MNASVTVPIAGKATALAALAALVAGLLAPVAASAQGAPAGYQEGIFDVVVAGLPTTNISLLVSPHGRFLLPLEAILPPLGIALRVARDSALARVTRPVGAGVATLRWGVTRSLEVVATAPLDSEDVVVTASGVYLAAPRLSALIEGRVEVDLATLTVHLERSGGFPVQIRQDVHQRRRDELRLASAPGAGTSPRVPFVPGTGFGVAEWGLGGSLAPVSQPTSVDLRGGMGLHGGMLKARTSIRLPSAAVGSAASTTEASYLRVFPEARMIRQLQLGDIVSEGAEARAIRGATITNAPFVRGVRFGDVAFSRPLPPGWEYEVYEGDRLVGFADATTRGALNVPINYGTTPLRVRLYGPSGEMTESALTYIIPLEQLREDEWQYAAGAGRCALRQCQALWYAEVRRGVTRWLTAQLGADEIRDSVGVARRPYGALSVLPSPGWAAGVQARQHAYLRGSVQRWGEERVTGAVSAGLNAPGAGGITATQEREAVWFASSALNLSRIVPRQGARVLSVSSRLEGRRRGGGRRWDVAATTAIPLGMLEVGMQSDPLAIVADDASGPAMVRIAPTLSLGDWHRLGVGAPLLRLESGFQRGGLVQWEGALSLQPGEGFASVALRHTPGVESTQLVIGASMALGVGRVLARAVSRAGRMEGGYSANGAVAFGSVRRATPLAYGGVGLAGVEGRAYRDRNANGVFDTGEEPAAGVTVRVGGLRVATDAAGRYSLWSALPYEPLEVQLDTLSLEDPAWVPAVASRTLRPSPHQFTRVEFALVHTRELVGQLEAGKTAPTPAGASVELREASTGALYRTRTFSDGAYYVSRMRPGRYDIVVASTSLQVLGAPGTSGVQVVVPPEGDEVVEAPTILLRRETVGPRR